LDEKLLFLYGLKKYGKGRWKKISVYLPRRYVLTVNEGQIASAHRQASSTTHPSPLFHFPRRSLVQIKSHAQKVMKRFDSGEDVLQRLDENQIRTEALVANIHDCLQEQGMKPPRGMTSIQMQQQPFQKIVKVTDAREQIVAASALCQLSQPALAERGPSFLLPTPSGHPDIRHIVLGSVITASGNVVKI
jgi:hypothetical protein